MDFKPCDKREKLLKFERDGTKNEIRRCSEPTADQFQQTVTPELCDSCPVRKHVIKRAQDVRAATVKVKDLYTIKKVAEHKPITREWLPCSDRQSVHVKTCCGGVGVVVRCNCEIATHFGQEVTPILCHNCPSRKG